MKTLRLNGRWQFRAIDAYRWLPPGKQSVTRWMNATVPGTVHTDLLEKGKIPDPFYRMEEINVQWVDSLQWVYRRTFVVPESLLAETKVELVAEGLDTYALIRCNGQLVGRSANMFVHQRFDIRRFLRAGTNTIEVLFDSPTIRSKVIEQRHGSLRVALEPPRVYVRKAQYSFGWDWGPKLTTSGIWRDIYLQAYSIARMENPFVRVMSITEKEAILLISVDIKRLRPDTMRMWVFVSGANWAIEQVVPVRSDRVTLNVRVPNPELWWPNGYGGQPMYTAVCSLISDGQVVDELRVPFAIRKIRLVRERDDSGESFIIEVNGERIFCKGADWIPADSFIPRIADSTYESLLTMAKQAHMNMIRVWGGGIYEQDIFYELCDRLGLMVWQDFMFACGEYPEEAWFLREVKEEAGKVVKRLRNHPSITVWCGNNECEWIFCTENPGKGPDDMRGARIFREVLPTVCRRDDGTRPYWRSSPFGKEFPNSESDGNHHQWVVWSRWQDFRAYENDKARFVTEFGFQAPANRKTFEEVTVPADRTPQSPVLEHHNKQVEGNERLFRFQAAHYRVGGTFDEFIYKSQLVQAEALKCAVEHWRRRKFDTAGTLFWQLNDCWPVSSWSAIDSALRAKALYYYARRFFAPVLASFKTSDDGVDVWITNDHLGDLSVRLGVSLRSFEGRVVWSRIQRKRVQGNSSMSVFRLRRAGYSGVDPSKHYLLVQVWVKDDLVSENRHFFVEPKHLQLPVPSVGARVKKAQKWRYVLTVRSNRFVKNLRLEVSGEDVLFSDNYFDVEARAPKQVYLTSRLPLNALSKRIKLRWLE